MNLDPSTLNLAASVLIVVVVARVATQPVKFDLWFFGLYALGSGAAAIAVLLALGMEFEVGVFLFGIAAVSGVYWTAASRPHRHLPLKGHAIAAAAGVGLAVLLAIVAIAYRWWMAPLTLLVLMGVGLVVNGLLPMIQNLRGKAPAQAPAEPVPAQSASRPAAPRPKDGAQQPAKIPIRCPTCGLQGQVGTAKAGKTLTCPRCKSGVPVPRPPRPGLAMGGKPVAPRKPNP